MSTISFAVNAAIPYMPVGRYKEADPDGYVPDPGRGKKDPDRYVPDPSEPNSQGYNPGGDDPYVGETES